MTKPLVDPRKKPVSRELEELIAFFDETLGFCPNSVLTMQIRPEIAVAFVRLNRAVMENKGRVTSSLKRLVAYMASYTAGCRYCQAHSIRAAERYGASTAQMQNIWQYRTHPAFDEAERAALDLAVAASGVPNGVDDALATRCKTYWDEGEIVEIMGVIALFGFLNRWNDSMATPLEGPSAASGNTHLAPKGWTPGKHS
jgi:alkylhydroperoxidase family enzyme